MDNRENAMPRARVRGIDHLECPSALAMGDLACPMTPHAS